MQQQKNSLGLAFAIALFLQQPFQKAAGNFAQFGESLAQQQYLLAMVARRPVCWLHATPSTLAQEQLMLGQLPNVAVVNEQVRLGDSDRHDFAHQLPGRGILVVTMVDETFHIDDPVNDARRVVIARR